MPQIGRNGKDQIGMERQPGLMPLTPGQSNWSRSGKSRWEWATRRLLWSETSFTPSAGRRMTRSPRGKAAATGFGGRAALAATPLCSVAMVTWASRQFMPGARVVEDILSASHKSSTIAITRRGLAEGWPEPRSTSVRDFCLLLFPSGGNYGFKSWTGSRTASKAGQK